jgi:heat shock protein HtpX
MNMATTHLTTRLRTWVLVAALTALVITLGTLIGGAFLWLFVALAVAFNLVGYLWSDRIALRLAQAQPLSDADAPELHRVARGLATHAAIPVPRLFLMPGDQPNAFATGRNPEHAAVAVTEGLLRSLPTEQVRGVLAHEFAHIRNRDILVSSLAAMIAGSIAAIANVLQLSFLFGSDDDDNPLGIVGSLGAILLAPLCATLLQLGISRQREYLADATAARLLGQAAPLADALEAMEREPPTALAVNPVTAPMYIVNPLGGGRVEALFSTHPPLRERIRRLRAYDGAGSVERSRGRARAAVGSV